MASEIPPLICLGGSRIVSPGTGEGNPKMRIAAKGLEPGGD
jgi:hypothetical protein